MESQTRVDLSLLSHGRSNKKNNFYTVAEIKSFLKEYGVSTSGSKTALVDRLRQVVNGEYVKPARSPRVRSPKARSPKSGSRKNRNNLDYFYVTLFYDVATSEEFDDAYNYWIATEEKVPISKEVQERAEYIKNNGPDEANLKRFEEDLKSIIRKTKGIEKIEHLFGGIDYDHDDGSYSGQVVLFIYLKVYYTPDLFKRHSSIEYTGVVGDIFNFNDVPDAGYLFEHLHSYFRGDSEFEEIDEVFD